MSNARSTRFCPDAARCVGAALGACVIGICAPTAGATDPITFTRDIAPIIFANCSECHRPNQAAPFSLLTYTDVQKRAKQIADVTKSRFMPPWLPESGDGCVSFIGARRLSSAQIETIQRWVEGGAVEGDAADLPGMPAFSNDWPLGPPDAIVRMSETYTAPPEGSDTLRTFVLPISLPHADVVKAIDFRPGNPRAAHHASFLVDATGNARMIDRDTPQPGYPGMGDIGLNLAGSFGTWSPAAKPIMFPDGVGRPIPKNCDISVEMHFNGTGKPEQVQPEIALYFVRENIDHRAVNFSMGSFFLDIPAGEKDYAIRDSLTLPISVKLLGVTPHAHYVCRKMNVEATLPDGTALHLLRINDWDFNWQQEYRYSEPIELPAGTIVKMEFIYDNSDDNPRNPNHPPKRVRIGSTASDEMALLFLTLIASDERDRPKLEEAHKENMLERMREAQIKRAGQSSKEKGTTTLANPPARQRD